MRQKIFKLSNIIFFLSLLTFACGSNNSKYSDLKLTLDNNGQTVEIDISNEIIIELESNPSTGYHWIHSNTDGSFFYQDGESTFSENIECSGTDGCDGLETLIFRSGQTGSGVITLNYSRTLEDEPEDIFTIYVNVY